MKKRKYSLSLMTTGRQGRKFMTSSSDEREANVRVVGLAEVEDVMDAAPAATDALRPKPEPAFRTLKVSMRKHYFLSYTFSMR